MIGEDLPVDFPNPWFDAAKPPGLRGLIAALIGQHASIHRDACACIGLLSTCDKHAAAFRSEVMPRSDDGVIEVLLSLIPPLPNPDAKASPIVEGAAAPKRGLPPWRADEVTAVARREELRLQALAALRQLITRTPSAEEAADTASRLLAAGGVRVLVAQILAAESISTFAVGEAALTLDAVVEASSEAELEVFRLAASAPLAEAVTEVLRTRNCLGASSDPRREATPPWSLEANGEPSEAM